MWRVIKVIVCPIPKSKSLLISAPSF